MVLCGADPEAVTQACASHGEMPGQEPELGNALKSQAFECQYDLRFCFVEAFLIWGF